MNAWWLRLATAATTGVIVGAFFVFLYAPSLREIEASEARVEELRKERAAIYDQFRGRDVLYRSRDRASAAAAALEESLLPSVDAAQAAIRAAADESGASVMLESGAPIRFGRYVARDIVIEASGSFAAVHGLIARLEALGDSVALRSVRLAPEGAGGAGAGGVRAKVVVATFILPREGSGPGAGPGRGTR